ncbi:hypothetical protein HON03_01055 [archaeon]|jgi:hypothetical protein|nr:hypothetical protein [archaeon]MBT5288044.1 hypothetical protein [archaeon]
MKLEDIRKEYEGHGLSDFDKFNKEFEVQGFELEKWDFLNSMCRAVINRMSSFSNYVVPFFIPGGYYNGLIMSNVKDEKTILRAKDTYKDIMILYHEALRMSLESDEKKQIEFLKDFWKRYPKVKKETLDLIGICENVFKIEDKEKKTGAYLG